VADDMTNREYLESVWEDVTFWPRETINRCYTISLGRERYGISRETIHEAEAAAAEFTRDRLEKIRQQKRDIENLEDNSMGWEVFKAADFKVEFPDFYVETVQ